MTIMMNRVVNVVDVFALTNRTTQDSRKRRNGEDTRRAGDGVDRAQSVGTDGQWSAGVTTPLSEPPQPGQHTEGGHNDTSTGTRTQKCDRNPSLNTPLCSSFLLPPSPPPSSLPSISPRVSSFPQHLSLILFPQPFQHSPHLHPSSSNSPGPSTLCTLLTPTSSESLPLNTPSPPPPS